MKANVDLYRLMENQIEKSKLIWRDEEYLKKWITFAGNILDSEIQVKNGRKLCKFKLFGLNDLIKLIDSPAPNEGLFSLLGTSSLFNNPFT